MVSTTKLSTQPPSSPMSHIFSYLLSAPYLRLVHKFYVNFLHHSSADSPNFTSTFCTICLLILLILRQLSTQFLRLFTRFYVYSHFNSSIYSTVFKSQHHRTSSNQQQAFLHPGEAIDTLHKASERPEPKIEVLEHHKRESSGISEPQHNYSRSSSGSPMGNAI
jgi:hypothetical protein